MNVIKITFFLFAAGTVVSCNTFKPAAKSPVSNNLAAVESSISPQNAPRFIESVKVNPSKLAEAGASSALSSATPIKASYSNSPARPVGIISTAAPVVENVSMLQFKYAIALDVPVEQITNLALYQFIDEWYATRYRFGGTTKNGIDCSSLMQKIYLAAYNKDIPRTAVTQYAATLRISKDELEEGDLIFFHTTRKGISHVGLYLGNNRFVHASSSRGVIISELTEEYYVRAYRAAGRFVEGPVVSQETEAVTEGSK
jgi:cell wall-associated NlpC family hydrolase